MPKRTNTERQQKTNESYDENWWKNENRVEDISKHSANLKEILNGSIVLKTFDRSPRMKFAGATLLSGVDENKKLCFELNDVQFENLKKIEEALERTFILQLKMMNPQYEDAKFTTCVKESEHSDNKYLKTKVQLLNHSRTMGVDAKGITVINVVEALSVPGTVFDVRVRIDGVYLTKERCGLMTKVELFRVISIPSEEDIEKEKEVKRAKLERTREEELLSF